jgi:hypothetical protein
MSNSVKLTWLENVNFQPTEVESLLMKETHILEDEDPNEKLMSLFEKITQLIKAGTRKAIINIQKYIEEENGILNYQNDKNGDTLVHIASRISNLEIVEIFLEAKADPNKQDFKGQTPLHAVVDSGNILYIVFKILLKY